MTFNDLKEEVQMTAEDDQQYLETLKGIVTILETSLPREIPLDISKTIDPCRAHILREACLHRIAELASSACDAFCKNRLITVSLR
jgi:hypothetical protein